MSITNLHEDIFRDGKICSEEGLCEGKGESSYSVIEKPPGTGRLFHIFLIIIPYSFLV